MATASPPSPPTAPPPPPPGGASGPVRPVPSRPRSTTRLLAGGALALVVLVVLFLVFGGSGGADYHLIFDEAGQLVRGDQVQVGGVPVGSVTSIELTKDFKARVDIHVDSSLTPLHDGTVAEVRVPSLSSVANRYIALSPGPNNRPALANGATLPASASRDAVDLDALFNTFNPATRKALAQVLQGSAEQYAGQGSNLAASTEYFGPSLAASDHVFAELVRDQKTFTSFLVESAKALTTIAARKEQLTDLVEHADQTFKAIGSEQSSLAAGLKQLPVTLQRGNRTFADLPAALGALRQLVDVSKPDTKTLTRFFEKLTPLVSTATPVVGNFSQAISRAGTNNDLTEAVRALPSLAHELTTASPSGVKALQESVPITAFFGPYAPDLIGTLRTFGATTAYYDASGHYLRLTSVVPDFKLGAKDNLTPANANEVLGNLKTGQLRRCPGAATLPASDGSSPFADSELLSCNVSEVP
jgi:phospholipid/cholesterol/gamma-HCH transport system substrate-binding protein